MRFLNKITLIIFCLFLWILFQFSQKTKNESHSLLFKLLTWNVRFDFESDGIYRWKNRKSDVISMINFHDPDFFGLQEPGYHQVKDLEENLVKYSSISVGRDDGLHKGEHLAIFWKKAQFKLLDTGNFWLSETPTIPGSQSWNTSFIRMTLWSKFKIIKTEKIFFYFTSHVDHTIEANYRGTKLNLEMMRKIAQGNLIFYSGDFNTFSCWPSCESIKYIEEEENDKVNMKNTKELSQQNHHGPISTSCGFYDKNHKMHPKWEIDFIFVSNFFSHDLEILKHATLSDRFQLPLTNTYYNPSDHHPVMIEFLIKF